MITPSLHCYLPDIAWSQFQLASGLRFDERHWRRLEGDTGVVAAFNQQLGFARASLPWTQLRLSAFEGLDQYAFACCVDPVLVHTTHRGVYMFGQAGLSINRQQALEIVASINESLMEDGEQLLMLDEKRWIYVSENQARLEAPDWRQLVGTDLFKFSYGDDASLRWQRLANEMQMLIHQLADYKGLIEIPPQYQVGVHLWQGINPQTIDPLEFARKDVCLYCEDPEIQQLCCQAVIEQRDINGLLQPNHQWPETSPALIWFGQNDESLAVSLLPRLVEKAESQQLTLRVHFADVCFDKRSRGLLKQLKAWFSGKGF